MLFLLTKPSIVRSGNRSRAWRAFERQLLDLLTAEKIKFVSSQVFWPFSPRQAAFGSYDQSRTTAELVGDEFGNFGLHCEDVCGQPVPPLGPNVGS